LLFDWPDAKASQPNAEAAAGRIRRRRHEPAARIPVPKPLAEAVAAGHFGHDEEGHPIRPGSEEVRVITERHAEKLTDILAGIYQASGTNPPEADRLKQLLAAAIADYAEDFGDQAARQLEAYAQRQAKMRRSTGISRS
jgi:hypothetical protein